jgi:Tfp pilus assembly protein PilE
MKKRNQGFLLMEVLFCIAIISSGIVLIFESYRTVIKALALSHDYVQATMLLEKKYIAVHDTLSFESDRADAGGLFTLRHNTLPSMEERAPQWNQIIIAWNRNAKESALETWCAVPYTYEQK